jgi:hypothetical protein
VRTSRWAVSALLLLASCHPRDRVIKRAVRPAEVIGEWEPSEPVGSGRNHQDEIMDGLQRLVLLDNERIHPIEQMTRDLIFYLVRRTGPKG